MILSWAIVGVRFRSRKKLLCPLFGGLRRSSLNPDD